MEGSRGSGGGARRRVRGDDARRRCGLERVTARVWGLRVDYV